MRAHDYKDALDQKAKAGWNAVRKVSIFVIFQIRNKYADFIYIYKTMRSLKRSRLIFPKAFR